MSGKNRNFAKISIMLGAITGDIIGSRFEFNNRLSTDFELFTGESSFTDDTICTVAVADALLHDKPFAETLQRWCRRYSFPKGGYGGSFLKWIGSDHPEPYNSFGNGSAMRVSPCVWLAADRETALRNARASAECTHNHPEGIRGAVAVADCIWQARMGASKEGLEVVAEWYYNMDMTCDGIRAANTFNETCQVTVPQAITCFLESSDFESSIRLAVSIGGDSDTIAAITGSIAEAFYGIPDGIKSLAERYLPKDMHRIYVEFQKRVGQ
jgi:ADP-ribosylglycohydrolase